MASISVWHLPGPENPSGVDVQHSNFNNIVPWTVNITPILFLKPPESEPTIPHTWKMEQSELQVSDKKHGEEAFAIRLQRQFCETIGAWVRTPVRRSPTVDSSKVLDTRSSSTPRFFNAPKLAFVDRCRILVAKDSQDAIPGLVDGSGLVRHI